MKIQQFLEHHGITCNPFADEDAQTDPVFKDRCLESTYHVAWDKIFGDPGQPATAIVFGEKGAGKTALRLQMADQLEKYNQRHPQRQVFVVEYDDFNPFLDRFREMLGYRGGDTSRLLGHWKLWDHMDAILALAVTQLVNQVLGTPDRPADEALPLDRLDRWQRRDLLVLAACYDRPPSESFKSRWHRLRRRLGYSVWRAHWDLALGIAVTLLVAGVVAGTSHWSWLGSVWPYLFVILGWGPRLWRTARCFFKAHGINRNVRVVRHDPRQLRQVLMHFTPDSITDQPLPLKPRTDDRYSQLGKLQSILRTLGYPHMMVLVDRVDEPHLINGSAELMRALVWPLLDNKLLKHPDLGFKLLLPLELSHFISREDREFYQRARLDKQNMIPSLEWTAEALYDVANARVRACAENGRAGLRTFFDASVGDERLMEALRRLRVPRHLFKFMYRLLVNHCNAHTDEEPQWEIGADTFEATLAVYLREQDAFDRGAGPG